MRVCTPTCVHPTHSLEQFRQVQRVAQPERMEEWTFIGSRVATKYAHATRTTAHTSGNADLNCSLSLARRVTRWKGIRRRWAASIPHSRSSSPSSAPACAASTPSRWPSPSTLMTVMVMASTSTTREEQKSVWVIASVAMARSGGIRTHEPRVAPWTLTTMLRNEGAT